MIYSHVPSCALSGPSTTASLLPCFPSRGGRSVHHAHVSFAAALSNRLRAGGWTEFTCLNLYETRRCAKISRRSTFTRAERPPGDRDAASRSSIRWSYNQIHLLQNYAFPVPCPMPHALCPLPNTHGSPIPMDGSSAACLFPNLILFFKLCAKEAEPVAEPARARPTACTGTSLLLFLHF